MSRVYVELSETIALQNSGIDDAEATQVGSGPVWADDSDATYVEIDGAYTDQSNPDFHARCFVTPIPQNLSGLNPAHSRFKCFLAMRLQGVEPGNSFPSVRIRNTPAGGTLTLAPVSVPECPDSPEWVTLEMGGDLDDVWFSPEDHELSITAGSMDLDPAGLFTRRSWRIYEVRLYFEVANRIETRRRIYPTASPARIYPRPSSRTRGRHGPESHI